MNIRAQNFSGANLPGADFSGANIQEADFSRARLQGTNFNNAKAGVAPLKAMAIMCMLYVLSMFSGACAGLAGIIAGNLWANDQIESFTTVLMSLVSLAVLLFNRDRKSKEAFSSIPVFVFTFIVIALCSSALLFSWITGNTVGINSIIIGILSAASILAGAIAVSGANSIARGKRRNLALIVAVVTIFSGAIVFLGTTIFLDNTITLTTTISNEVYYPAAIVLALNLPFISI